MDEWLKEAKADMTVLEIGMYLVHNGIVRQSPKAQVRQGIDDGTVVTGMEFSFDGLQFLVEKIKTECVTEIEQKI